MLTPYPYYDGPSHCTDFAASSFCLKHSFLTYFPSKVLIASSPPYSRKAFADIFPSVRISLLSHAGIDVLFI